MKTVARLWNEETGAILSAEIVIVATILVIGVIVGLSAVRDSVVSELADVAQALANLCQSFSISGTAGHHSFSGGGSFIDTFDFCDVADLTIAQNSKCVVICTSGVVCETVGAP